MGLIFTWVTSLFLYVFITNQREKDEPISAVFIQEDPDNLFDLSIFTCAWRFLQERIIGVDLKHAAYEWGVH